MKKIFVTALTASLVFTSCSKKANPENNNTTTPTEKASMNSKEVTFNIADKYFVKNTVEKIDNPKIETEEKFNEIFGMATVMGKDGAPTKIDFAKQYVIAVTKPTTNIETKLVPVSLKKEEGKLNFTYKVETGEKQSFETKPSLVIIVDKSNEGQIVLNEQ